MAKKEVWDTDTLKEELDESYNALDSIPARHLRKLQRLLMLQMYYERFTLVDRLASKTDPSEIAAVKSEVQGKVLAYALLNDPVTRVINGTFEHVDVDSVEEDYAHEREREYRDEFYDD